MVLPSSEIGFTTDPGWLFLSSIKFSETFFHRIEEVLRYGSIVSI